MEATYSIGEIAHQAGLSPSGLRYYEEMGLLPTPDREGGRRRYRGDVLDRLAMIRLVQQAGFTLRETRTLLASLEASAPVSEEASQLGRTKLAEVDAVIARAREMRDLLRSALDCDCLTALEGEEFRRAALAWIRSAALADDHHPARAPR